jgi:hypothetical protein
MNLYSVLYAFPHMFQSILVSLCFCLGCNHSLFYFSCCHEFDFNSLWPCSWLWSNYLHVNNLTSSRCVKFLFHLQDWLLVWLLKAIFLFYAYCLLPLLRRSYNFSMQLFVKVWPKFVSTRNQTRILLNSCNIYQFICDIQLTPISIPRNLLSILDSETKKLDMFFVVDICVLYWNFDRCYSFNCFEVE